MYYFNDSRSTMAENALWLTIMPVNWALHIHTYTTSHCDIRCSGSWQLSGVKAVRAAANKECRRSASPVTALWSYASIWLPYKRRARIEQLKLDGCG